VTDSDHTKDSPQREALPITSVADVDALLLADPGPFEELLKSYFLPFGHRPWWALCNESDEPSWQKCVSKATARVARETRVRPATLRDWLEFYELPKARRRVLRLARQLLFVRRVA
jgi:hypothetical protein